MATYLVPIGIDRRILPFLKKDASIVLNIQDLSSGQAILQVNFRDGVTVDMLESISPAKIALVFPPIQEIPVEDQEILKIKPALPQVENEYDEVRDKISTTLDSPVQSLFTGNSFKNNVPIRKFSGKRVEEDSDTVVELTEQEVEQPQDPEEQEDQGNNQLNMLQNQMISMMEQLKVLQSGSKPKLAPAPRQQVQVPRQQAQAPRQQDRPIASKNYSIMSYEEFKQLLEEAGEDFPDIDPNKRLTKDEALALEKYRLKKPVYVISTQGQLLIDDVGISIRSKVASNLSTIPLIKLKKSNDIHRCFSNGMLKFVDVETAKKLAESSDLMSSSEGGDSKLKVFFGEKSHRAAEQDEGVDVTPGAMGDEGPSSERILKGARNNDILIADVDEVDENNVNDLDEQTQLLGTVNLTGSSDVSSNRVADEPISDAMKASMMTKQIGQMGQASKTWKPIRNLDRED